jgi:WhiB family redox-sensing transcriptional regulator
MDWRHRAKCKNEDPELFFPVGSGPAALAQTADAVAVCRRCPVASDCLAWALATGQDDGIWGGMTEDGRRLLRRPDAARRARETAPERHGRAGSRLAGGGTRGRENCDVCGNRHPLRLDGAMVKHNRTLPAGAGHVPCEGSGQVPAAEEARAAQHRARVEAVLAVAGS